MSNTEMQKKLQEIAQNKCNSKGCLSGYRDNLEVVWFGSQYSEKNITCSSCYIMNDEAVKKSTPTAFNVLPIRAFFSKFTEEAKLYEDKKSSVKWAPTDLASRQKEHLGEMQKFQNRLIGTLKALNESLEKFTKRVIEANGCIYNQETFNEIIKMYSSNQFNDILSRLHELIKYLNCGEDGKYRFYDQEFKNKKQTKLSNKIDEITKKVLKVLDDLLNEINQKNSVILKM